MDIVADERETGKQVVATMKFITLTQPWATLMVIRAKKIETRGWSMKHRGPLGIHAAKGFPDWAKDLVKTEPFQTALRMGIHGHTRYPVHWHDLPLGQALGAVNVIGCESTNDEAFLVEVSEEEMEFGDYSPGRFGILTELIGRLRYPIPMKGALSLWDGPDILPMLEARNPNAA